jgi:hypothetical protein
MLRLLMMDFRAMFTTSRSRRDLYLGESGPPATDRSLGEKSSLAYVGMRRHNIFYNRYFMEKRSASDS